MRALAHYVILADGWRRALIAVAAGAFGALAMPPFGAWPALVVSLSVATWLIDGAAAGRRFPRAATLRRAAVAGWLWGLGYFVGGLWWIGAAFLVEADVFAWLMPFGVLGLPALLAIFPALGFAIARLVWSNGAGRIAALALGLTLSEWLRGHVLTGFPWNALGMAFGQNAWLMQSASILGLWGLTLVAVLTLAAPATFGTGETARGRVGPPLAAAATLIVMAAFGAARLAADQGATVPGVNLRIMQPNLDQSEKFAQADGGEILRRYLELSASRTSADSRGLADVTHLVWPESAFPFLLHREPVALSRIAAALPKGAVLITGAARSIARPAEEGGGTAYYNAIQVVGDDGGIVATYDKVHLVPFGEYVPAFLDRMLRSLGLRQFITIPGGFTAGARQSALTIPGIGPAAGSVCYEAIFPDETMPPGPRPRLILNVTNDGWFGDTPGPRQHFAQARLRAVERGLPLVRAANTGISAVVDPFGRIIASLPVGREGVVDAKLPQALNRTTFDDFGTAIVGVLCILCLACAYVSMHRTMRAA